MSKLRVNEITNTLNNGPVVFPFGAEGDGSNMTLRPGIETFNPSQLATDVALDSVIEIGFNQNMMFHGTGTIYIREGSKTGTIFEQFECGVSIGATITNNLLTITPSTDFAINKTYYVSLPSAGIANTLGANIQPLDNYQFNTILSDFTATGGDEEFVVADGNSPTGYYKYHIFSSPGTLVTSAPSNNSDDLDMMIIAGGGSGGTSPNSPSSTMPSAGGGGAGGYISHTQDTWNLAAGTYTFTRGEGGQTPPGSNPEASLPNFQGENSTLISPTYNLTVYGGGWGGSPSNNTPAEVPPGSGNSGGSGGGGGGSSEPVANWNQGGGGVSGQGTSGARYTNSNFTPTGQPFPVSPAQPRKVGGGGGGSGQSGQEGIYYYAPYPQTGSPPPSGNPRYNARFGKGGDGTPNPAFPGPVIAPRVTSIPVDTFQALGPTGNYWAGGGSAGGSPSVASQIGGYGGGGKTASPWQTGNPGFGQPSVTDPVLPRNGAVNTGGGGGGGTNNSSPTYGGAGGPGVMMIRYSHPGS